MASYASVVQALSKLPAEELEIQTQEEVRYSLVHGYRETIIPFTIASTLESVNWRYI